MNTYNSENAMTQKLTQPPYLKAGDTVAIVAPSGILLNRETEIERAKNLLKSWNLNVVIGKYIFNKNNHFAGTDYQRALDFQEALDNPNIKAIWCARGGYGAVRILDNLDYTKFKENPKWLIGYSDITALLSQVHNLGYENIHGMMCTSLADKKDDIAESISTLKKALFGEPLLYTLKSNKYNKNGEVKGLLIGGNLSILQTMLGSETALDTTDKILFIEEIGEYKYHIDRLLQSLKRAGYFDNCKAVIVGDMTKLRRNTTSWGKPIEQLILDVFEECDFPVLFDFPAGHEKDNRALIFGRNVELKITSYESTIEFEN
ncbi:MAG: LD-carboxypeptidase [Flavobacteriaceae bacterium]|nr:LD-carboxypeptidase [Flavobacteriaceae bacterium]